MNRGLGVLALTSVMFAAVASPRPVTANGVHPTVRPRVAITVFHLQVEGRPQPGTTFWVAYGPLQGKFGLVRLLRQADGTYTAMSRLPTDGRTVFSYLAGQGTARTRLGVVPGNPVMTFRQIGPRSVWPVGVPLVRWQVPAG